MTVRETLELGAVDCLDCAAQIERSVAALPGVVSAALTYPAARLNVEYEDERIGRAEVVARVRELGYEVDGSGTTRTVETVLELSGLDCPDCAAKVEKRVGALPEVATATVVFAASQLRVEHVPTLTPARIVAAVRELGYDATPLVGGRPATPPIWRRLRGATSTGLAGLFVLIGLGLDLLGLSSWPAYAVAFLIVGVPAARRAFAALRRTRTLDMNALMVTAAVGATLIGEWSEAATVLFLFALGNLLESLTLDRARASLQALVAVTPQRARVKRGEAEVEVPASHVAPGEIVTIRPGERIPVDGGVVAGASSVDESVVTGESLPVAKASGATVYAGSLNERGYLEVVVTKRYEETTLARLIRLVEEAQSSRAPTQRLVDRFARYYTPAVLLSAGLIAVLPWLVLGQPFDAWFYRALVLLVIACPCALVISTPVAIAAGVAAGARRGILFKGGAVLEAVGSLAAVAFDKTGTLTHGRPEVAGVYPVQGATAASVARIAAAIEWRSEHPLAAAVLRHAATLGLDPEPARDFESLPGRGARARVGEAAYYVGSARLFGELGIDLDVVADVLRALEARGETPLLVGRAALDAGDRPELLGVIAVVDGLRPEAAAAVAALRGAGVQHVVMLTGDRPATAAAVASQVGIAEYRAELLPEEKVSAVTELAGRYGSVAMVGDGVNDAPALATATVGVAMGAAGTDVALETADVALLADDLTKLPAAIQLSRRTLSIIRQNIAFSLLTKVLFIGLTFAGFTTLWLAIAADMGASLLVTGNSMRLLWGGRPVEPRDGLTSAGPANACGCDSCGCTEST